jgi:hypothetical protein
MADSWIELANGRRYEIAKTNGLYLEEGQYVVVDDGDTIRARLVETALGAGMVIFDGDDRVCQVSGEVLVLARELP